MNKSAADHHDRTNPNGGKPALSRVVERNIQTLTSLREDADRARGVQDRLADAITAFSGHMVFVYVHVAWFGLWIVFNSGLFGVRPFDPFPYGLLTMIVSLEAIFLTTFVLISQNRSNADAERRADLALHIGLLTEHEVTRVLELLDALQTAAGIEHDPAGDLADLEVDTKPEDVLAEIDRLQKQALRRA